MTRLKQASLALIVAVVALGAGYQFYSASRVARAAEQAAQSLLQLSLPDSSGTPIALSTWQGKVLIVNFWATWCVPCREEIPELIKIRRNHAAKGVEIVGIAIDNADKVKQYAGEMSIAYPLLIGGVDILGIGKALGNKAGVLPFTVVLDRDGRRAYTHAGAITEASLTPILLPLLQPKPL